MDETKFSLRQKKILAILTEKPLSREKISLALVQIYPVSKITLIRDLNHLVGLGIIEKAGTGNSVGYVSTEKNPLLNYIDIKEYFDDQVGRDKLGLIKFNFDLFDDLKNLIKPQDLKEYGITGVKLSGQEKKLDPTIFRREIERFMIEFSWKSSKIEGNTYSLLETEVLIKQLKEAPGHSKYEAIMILNHKRAIDFIFKNREKFKEINIFQILSLHEILTKDLEVTNYLPLSSKKDLETALIRLIKTVNAAENSLEKALIALSCVSYIQPFADGNKRTARVLANAVLIAHDSYPVSFRNVETTDYLKALLLFYEKNNLFHFKRMFLEQYSFALQNYFRS